MAGRSSPLTRGALRLRCWQQQRGEQFRATSAVAVQREPQVVDVPARPAPDRTTSAPGSSGAASSNNASAASLSWRSHAGAACSSARPPARWPPATPHAAHERSRSALLARTPRRRRRVARCRLLFRVDNVHHAPHIVLLLPSPPPQRSSAARETRHLVELSDRRCPATASRSRRSPWLSCCPCRSRWRKCGRRARLLAGPVAGSATAVMTGAGRRFLRHHQPQAQPNAGSRSRRAADAAAASRRQRRCSCSTATAVIPAGVFDTFRALPPAGDMRCVHGTGQCAGQSARIVGE